MRISSGKRVEAPTICFLLTRLRRFVHSSPFFWLYSINAITALRVVIVAVPFIIFVPYLTGICTAHLGSIKDVRLLWLSVLIKPLSFFHLSGEKVIYMYFFLF